MSLELNPKNFPHDNLGWMKLWMDFFSVYTPKDAESDFVINNDLFLGRLNVGEISGRSNETGKFFHLGINVPVRSIVVGYDLEFLDEGIMNTVKVFQGRGEMPFMCSYWQYAMSRHGLQLLNHEDGSGIFEGKRLRIEGVGVDKAERLHEDAYRLTLLNLELVKNVKLPPLGSFWDGVFI